MTPTFKQPSVAYWVALEQAKIAHFDRRSFSGTTCYRSYRRLIKFVQQHRPKTALDYGCGKGRQLTDVGIVLKTKEKLIMVNSWREALRLDKLYGYDPAWPYLDKLPHTLDPRHKGYDPAGGVDLVYSTDVLEHIPASDLPWVIQRMSDMAKKCIFLNAASYSAQKSMANGDNAHYTVEPPDWWHDIVRRNITKRGVHWELFVTLGHGKGTAREYKGVG